MLPPHQNSVSELESNQPYGGKRGIRTHGGITLACLANRCNQPALPASRVKDRCIGLRIALRCLTRPKFARSANLRNFAPVAPHFADVLASCGYGASDGIRTRVPGSEGRCPAFLTTPACCCGGMPSAAAFKETVRRPVLAAWCGQPELNRLSGEKKLTKKTRANLHPHIRRSGSPFRCGIPKGEIPAYVRRRDGTGAGVEPAGRAMCFARSSARFE